MQRNFLLLTVALLFTQSAGAAYSGKSEARVAFRKAVEQYQGFVIPRCAPADVEEYVKARAERDRLFVQSLRKTKLLNDYYKAVAHRAKHDANMRFECMQPVSPPSPSLGMSSTQTLPSKETENTRAKFFMEGDRQFAVMLRLRRRRVWRCWQLTSAFEHRFANRYRPILGDCRLAAFSRCRLAARTSRPGGKRSFATKFGAIDRCYGFARPWRTCRKLCPATPSPSSTNTSLRRGAGIERQHRGVEVCYLQRDHHCCGPSLAR